MTSTQKDWAKLLGLTLVILGAALHMSIFFYSLLPHTSEYLVVVFWMLCPIGVFLYGTATGHGWWWRVGWCFIAVMPLFGPPYVVVAILLEEFTKKQVTVGLGALGVVGSLLYGAIALPGFLTYQSKARQSEAKINLGGIFTSATVIKEERKTFAISDISQLGFRPGGTPKYSLWYSVNGVPTMIPGSSQAKSPCDVTTPPKTVRVAASATGFTAAAKGNTDSDPTCDEWSINDQRVLTNTLNDIIQ